MAYQNIFERSKNLKNRFTVTWKTRDGELLAVSGVIKRIGGDMFTIDEVDVRLPGGKPAHRALDESLFAASSQRGVVNKLNQYLGNVSITHDTDPLKLEFERDRHERNRSSSYTERTVRREPARAPAPTLVFGCAPQDVDSLKKLFDAAFFAWGADRAAQDAEFRGDGMDQELLAIAQRNMRENINSMTRLLMHWGRTNPAAAKVLTKDLVLDAENYLRQHGNWMPLQRKRGQSLGRPWYPPEAEAPASAPVDPRKLSFEELQRIERARQQKVRREKNLSNVRNGLGVIV